MSQHTEARKFWAFCLLLLVIALLAYMSKGDTTFVLVDGKPVSVQGGSILRDAMVGLIAVLGTAAQALFRTSENAAQMNDLLHKAVESLAKSTPQVRETPDDIKDAAEQVANAATAEAEAIANTDSTGTPSAPDTSSPPHRG